LRNDGGIMAVDPIVITVDAFKEKYNLTSETFIELNAMYSLLDLIADRSEAYAMTGNERVLDEIHDYIEKQKSVK